MKLHPFLLALTMIALVAAGLFVVDARAQTPGDEQAVVRTDTVVVRGGGQTSGPASVQRVRRRIRQIGGGGTVRRVIYPLIVVPTVRVHVTEEDGQIVVGQPARPEARPYYGDPYDDPYLLDPEYDAFYGDGDAPYFGQDEPLRLWLRRQRAAADNAGLLTDSLRTVIDSLLALPSDSLRQAPLPPPVVEEEPPPPQQVTRSILYTGLFRIIGVNFEFDQSDLLPEARTSLDVVGEALVRYPELRVEVAGHTDAIGPAEYNQQLSQRRAETVRQYLLDSIDIAPERITARGYGETEPLASNETTTGRTLNRRVEIRVLNPEAAEQYYEEVVPMEGDPERSMEQFRESLRQIIREEIRRVQGNEQ